MALFPYQERAVDHAISHSANHDYTLIASPTGTGKTYMELALWEELPNPFIITPKIEIIRDALAKLGYRSDIYSEETLLSTALHLGISTPMRVRNAMLKGEWTRPIRYLIWDEVHHHSADSWSLVDLMAGAKNIGFSATPYRGTPKDTARFRATWGEPYWAIRLPDAIAEKRLSMPSIHTVPLIDDDIVKVTSGEFQVESLEDAILTRLDGAASLIDSFLQHPATFHAQPLLYDMPTMVALPGKRSIAALGNLLTQIAVPHSVITQETSFEDRRAAFQSCIDCKSVLLQIDVVSEGVDLPQLRRLIDLRPTLSPVKWLQLLGRITRPGRVPPEYYCCNRNLLRHAYLLEGCIPADKVVEAQNAFPKSYRATAGRAVGLEALGRFKPTTVTLENGLDCVFYNLSSIDNGVRIDYAIILHPLISEPVVAKKESQRSGDSMQWGKWEKVDTALTEFTGYQSVQPKCISDKQRNWWDRSAARFGLATNAEPNVKQFQILPVLNDLQLRVV